MLEHKRETVDTLRDKLELVILEKIKEFNKKLYPVKVIDLNVKLSITYGDPRIVDVRVKLDTDPYEDTDSV